MQLSTRQVGTVTVIDMSGKNPGGRHVSLREAIDRLHSSGQRRIVLNLADLEYLDSAGLGELVACNTRSQLAGTPLKLASVTGRLHNLLRMTRLVAMFETYNTLEDALASFDEKPPPPTAQW